MRLSEGNHFKTCAKPQAHNPKLNRANRYENEMVLKISRFKLFRRISYCSRAAKRVFQTGGVSRSGLVLPFLSFWDFPRDFPDLSGDSPGIFPIGPFPLSRPIISTYEEQSREGSRHNLDHSRTKWETPGFGNPLV